MLRNINNIFVYFVDRIASDGKPNVYNFYYNSTSSIHKNYRKN